MMNVEECAKTARGCWMLGPTCEGWWWCRCRDGEIVLTRVTRKITTVFQVGVEAEARVEVWRYQPFGCARDYDLLREGPVGASWQHAGLAEPSPPTEHRPEEPEMPRPLYVTYSYTRTGDHAPYREIRSELMGGVEDVLQLVEAMHCPVGARRLGGQPDVETYEGSHNDPEFEVLSVRAVTASPLEAPVKLLIDKARYRKQAYFNQLREFRAHRRGLDRARAELREAQEVLRQAEDFLAQHGHQLNVGGLDMAHRSVEEAREAVCRRQADIDAMAAPDRLVGRPYKGIWASDDEIQPAPKGAPHAEGDD